MLLMKMMVNLLKISYENSK